MEQRLFPSFDDPQVSSGNLPHMDNILSHSLSRIGQDCVFLSQFLECIYGNYLCQHWGGGVSPHLTSDEDATHHFAILNTVNWNPRKIHTSIWRLMFSTIDYCPFLLHWGTWDNIRWIVEFPKITSDDWQFDTHLQIVLFIEAVLIETPSLATVE